MSKEHNPAFQFYAAEYLADENVQIMTIEEEGCYCRLMAYCWREGSIPSDLELLTRLCKGVTPSRVVVACFDHPSTDASRLLHPRLEVERLKQDEWRRKSAKGGKNSAHKRKHTKQISIGQGGSTTLPRVVEPNGNTSSSFASASSNTPYSPPRGTCEIGKKLNGHCEGCQAGFDAFWGAYPRLEPGRKQVRKSWCKAWSVGAIPSVPDMLRWITEAKLSEQWQDVNAIPHATTWINQRRWEGNPPPKPKKISEKQTDTSFLFEEL